jgi:hypothetical protein
MRRKHMSRMTPLLVILVAALVVVLWVRGSEVITALAISSTNSSIATVNISNAPSEVFNVRCFDASDNSQLTTVNKLALIGGDIKTIYCNATVMDANGVRDIKTFYGSVHSDTSTNFDTCAEDNVKCYVNETCINVTDINTSALEVRCTYKIWFNAQNTTIAGSWTPNITIIDTSGNYVWGDLGNRTNFSVDTLLAIGVNPLLAFGAKNAGTNMTNLGSTGADSPTVCAGATGGCNHTTSNYGNTQIDLQVNASVMACSQTGSITAEYIKVSTSYNDAYTSGYPLTATLGDSTSSLNTFNLASNATVGVPNSQPTIPTAGKTYWGVGIPLSAAGNCQGTIHFAAILG